jgi:hypothetical protein
MKQAENMMKKRVFVAAIEGVFLAMCAMPAHADDAEALALKTPVNKAEFGLSATSQSSQKFGEYTGLNKSGGHSIAWRGCLWGQSRDTEMVSERDRYRPDITSDRLCGE